MVLLDWKNKDIKTEIEMLSVKFHCDWQFTKHLNKFQQLAIYPTEVLAIIQ